jgi:hypothetical protein
MISSSTNSSSFSTPRTNFSSASPAGQSPARANAFPMSPSWADDDDEFFDSCADVASPVTLGAPKAKPQFQVMANVAEGSKPQQTGFGGKVSMSGKGKNDAPRPTNSWGMPNPVAPNAGASRFDGLAPSVKSWRQR